MANYCPPTHPTSHPTTPKAGHVTRQGSASIETNATIRLMVNGHATSLQLYVFGFRSVSAKLELLDRREDVNDVSQWVWPDDMGIVTFENVRIDTKGMLFVAAFNAGTYQKGAAKVLYGNDYFAGPTQMGYLFEVTPTGTDHTVNQTITNTDGFAGAIEARTRGGSVDLSVPIGPFGGTAGVTGTNTRTDPTNSGSTARSASNTYVVKVVEGISVKKSVVVQPIQSMIETGGVNFA